VAADDDLLRLDGLIRSAGEDPELVGLERIELDDFSLGGAELLSWWLPRLLVAANVKYHQASRLLPTIVVPSFPSFASVQNSAGAVATPRKRRAQRRQTAREGFSGRIFTNAEPCRQNHASLQTLLLSGTHGLPSTPSSPIRYRWLPLLPAHMRPDGCVTMWSSGSGNQAIQRRSPTASNTVSCSRCRHR
jgi:hypothetical protein